MSNNKQKKKKSVVQEVVEKGAERFNPATNRMAKAGRKFVGAVAKKAVKGALGLMINDKSWYSHYPEAGLINANFGLRKGILQPGIGRPSGSNITDRSVPSVAGLTTILTTPKDTSSAFIQGINQLYTYIRQANAGAVNYTAKDLACYVISAANIHAGYASLKRAHYLLNSYNVYDALLPQAYFAAMGFDYDTFAQNAADLRAYANQASIFIADMIPLKIDMFERYRWMFSTMFADSNDAKASVYLFNPLKLVSYTGSNNSPVTVDWSSWSRSETTTGQVYATVIANFKKLLAAFRDSDKFNTIAGDILKAYGKDSLYTAEVWDETTKLLPVYSEEVLTQIQNANIFGDAFASVSYNLVGGYPAQQLTVSAIGDNIARQCALSQFHTPFINTYKDSMDAADLMSATRLQPVLDDTDWNAFLKATNGTDVILKPICGTEMIAKCYAFNASETGGFAYKIVSSEIGGVDLMTNAQMPITAGDDLFNWAAMDWAPRFALIVDIVSGGSHTYSVLGPLWDFNNYAFSNTEAHNNYHAYATLNLLYSPHLIKTSKTELITKNNLK